MGPVTKIVFKMAKVVSGLTLGFFSLLDRLAFKCLEQGVVPHFVDRAHKTARFDSGEFG